MRKILLLLACLSCLLGAVFAGTTPPEIVEVKFNDKEIVNNDYITKDARLTATVTDPASGISTIESKITIDTTEITFANLTSPASYDATTGLLLYDLNLTNGTHTIKITAVDNNSNTSTYQRTVEVNSGSTSSTLALAYPNPFNPNQGKAKIAYTLTRDTGVNLYIFNELNQLVMRRSYIPSYPGGSAGYNEIEWDGTDDNNRPVGNGPYYVRILAGGRSIGRIKIAVLR